MIEKAKKIAAGNFLSEFFFNDGRENFGVGRIVPAVADGDAFFTVFAFDDHRDGFAVFVFGHSHIRSFD